MSKALKIERFGQNFFSLLEEMVDDEESRRLFGHLSAEEESHCQMFREELQANGGEIAQEDDIDPDKIFNVGVAKIIRKGSASVFTFAIQIEQRMIDFYRTSMNDINDSGFRKFLSNLIEFEETHKQVLNEKLAQVQPA